ncbi:unnamed protein product [Miscanthus lutarioriparius]|uniref:Uncharacterized protein n=1 Tax=Miscanthus lutarioriparius TaxID=422564 RepID=A0A811R058_9POAL|nr:unnamed protein product [Miscanthus lutarioriparius]
MALPSSLGTSAALSIARSCAAPWRSPLLSPALGPISSSAAAAWARARCSGADVAVRPRCTDPLPRTPAPPVSRRRWMASRRSRRRRRPRFEVLGLLARFA